MGRPKSDVDWKRVDKMLLAQCSGTEIAAYLGIDDNTLYRACQRDHNIGFGTYSQQKRAKGQATAKEAFFDKAFKDKDTAAAIFWTKQHLGWSDKKDVKMSGELNQVARVMIELPDNTRQGDTPATGAAEDVSQQSG